MSHGRPVDIGEVIALGQDNIDADVAKSGQVEGGDDRAIGDKIGGHNTDMTAGAGDGAQDHPLQFCELFIGAVGDTAGHTRRYGAQGRKMFDSSEIFAGGKLPVVNENLLQVSDNRPFDAKMKISGREVMISLQDMVVANIDSPRKADFAVDDQDLAVVAQIEGHNMGWEEGGEESYSADIGAAKASVDGREGVAQAGGVDKNTHFDSAGVGGLQSGDEALAGGVIIKDIAGEVDRMLCFFNSLEHGRVGLITVEEGGDFCAGQKGAVDYLIDQRHEAHHGLAGLRESEAELFFGDGFDGGLSAKFILVGAQALGAAVDSVHAKDQIGEDPDEGGKPDKGGPGDGRAWFAAC